MDDSNSETVTVTVRLRWDANSQPVTAKLLELRILLGELAEDMPWKDEIREAEGLCCELSGMILEMRQTG